jgi:peptidyl-prolyl cis-trans isomerase SurA
MKLIVFIFLFIFSPATLPAPICRPEQECLDGEWVESLKLAEAQAQQIDTTASFKRDILLFQAEISQSEREGEAFRQMSEAYRKGLLIYEITNKEVWKKTEQDTAGLRRFFENHRICYQWAEPHFRGYVIHSKTQKDRERMQQEIAGMTPDAAVSYLKKTYITQDTAFIKISIKGIWVKGEDEYVDELIFQTGKKGVPYLEFPRYFVIGELLEKPEDYTDVLSEVMNDYGQYLERIWLAGLKKKYADKNYTSRGKVLCITIIKELKF